MPREKFSRGILFAGLFVPYPQPPPDLSRLS